MHADNESSGAPTANISEGIRREKKTWCITMNIRVFDLSLMRFSTFLIQARLIQLNQSYLEEGGD